MVQDFMRSSESLNKKNLSNPSGDFLRIDIQQIGSSPSVGMDLAFASDTNNEAAEVGTRNDDRDLGSLESLEPDNRGGLLSEREFIGN